MGGFGGQSLESVKPGEKGETGGPGQGVRCLCGTWKGYEGASSRSHTDWKGRAQGSLEGRQGPRKGGSDWGTVLYTCQYSWRYRSDCAAEPWS